MDFLKRHDQHRVRPVAVNETVPQAGVAIVSSFSVDMVREITINCWPRRWMGWGMASTCPYYLGPDHPSHCLHPVLSSPPIPSPPPSAAPARYSPALCGTFKTEGPAFTRLALSLHSFHTAPACSNIEFLPPPPGVAGSSEPRSPRGANSRATDLPSDEDCISIVNLLNRACLES